MSFLEELGQKAELSGNILCMGMDPVLEKIPYNKILNSNTWIDINKITLSKQREIAKKAIPKFFFDILDAVESEGISFPAVKPNIAFFEQYGIKGMIALKKIIKKYSEKGFHIILDGKRGDIGKTAEAYAKSVFRVWKADAVTVNPYLGHDSIKPFLNFKNKGVYVLNRTSNKSAVEIQDLKINNERVFEKVSDLIIRHYSEGIGSVVGATYPEDLEKISKKFVDSGKKIPLLIPGVGKQGGSGKEATDILKKTNNPLWLHRVNSSSGISYAWMKNKKQDYDEDYAGAAVKEIKRLIKELKI